MKKILILSANPKNTEKLRLDEEVREIQASLKRAKNREQFEIVTEWAVRVDDLRHALLDYQPTIVHFSGHGSESNGLAFENNSGQMQVVSTESLARLFKLFQNTVECVLLNACYSEVQAEGIHQHINYVIGMNRAIGDKGAIKFSVGFYDALGAGRTYEDCFKIGCAAIDLEGIPESETPIIKLRLQKTEFQKNQQSTPPIKSSVPETTNIQQTAADNAIVFGQIGRVDNLNIQK
ncbi:MAG: CHAT domain-containing protein [Heteroscytonema crispum UTEX LB 1556]